MNDYILMTDSSCDLPAALAEELGLAVIPLSVVADGKSYFNYLDGREIEFSQYYHMLRDGKDATTSAANVSDFLSFMEPLLKEGKDILYLGFSSALSGTYNAGAVAAAELREKYPQRKILTVDTLCASMGQGLLVWHTAQQKQAGKSIEEAAAYAEQTRDRLCHWFTVDDLNFLHKGGRVSKTTAVLGGALQMKPIMHCDSEGRLTKMGVTRGRKASIAALKNKLVETADDPQNQTVFISHGDCLDDALTLERMLREEVGVHDVVISYVGPVIGTHSGPGTLALFHLGAPR